MYDSRHKQILLQFSPPSSVILFAGGQANLYSYVLNDPINFIDPTGTVNWGNVGRGGLLMIGGGLAVVGGIALTPTNPILGPIGTVIGAGVLIEGGILFAGGLADDGSPSFSGPIPNPKTPMMCSAGGR